MVYIRVLRANRLFAVWTYLAKIIHMSAKPMSNAAREAPYSASLIYTLEAYMQFEKNNLFSTLLKPTTRHITIFAIREKFSVVTVLTSLSLWRDKLTRELRFYVSIRILGQRHQRRLYQVIPYPRHQYAV